MSANTHDGLTRIQRETRQRERFWYRVGLALIAVSALGFYGSLWLIRSLMHHA